MSTDRYCTARSVFFVFELMYAMLFTSKYLFPSYVGSELRPLYCLSSEFESRVPPIPLMILTGPFPGASRLSDPASRYFMNVSMHSRIVSWEISPFLMPSSRTELMI